MQLIKQILVAPFWGKWQALAKLFYPGYNQMMNESLGESTTPIAVLAGQQIAGGITCHNNHPNTLLQLDWSPSASGSHILMSVSNFVLGCSTYVKDPNNYFLAQF